MTLANTFIAIPPPKRYAEDGLVIRVGNTRVPLDTVIGEYNDGASAEEIVLSYDSLSLADVHAVISYYLRHREQVEEYMKEREVLATDSRRTHESVWPGHIRERLQARSRKASRAPGLGGI
jgi:uncharacterized protein (DUF433 family)